MFQKRMILFILKDRHKAIDFFARIQVLTSVLKVLLCVINM